MMFIAYFISKKNSWCCSECFTGVLCNPHDFPAKTVQLAPHISDKESEAQLFNSGRTMKQQILTLVEFGVQDLNECVVLPLQTPLSHGY